MQNFKVQGWYKIAKFSEISTHIQKESDLNFNDVKKGLMWGAGVGLIPATIGLMNPTNSNKEQFPIPEKVPAIQQKMTVQPSENVQQKEVQEQPLPQPNQSIDKILNVIKQLESSGGKNSVPRFEPAFLAKYRNTKLMSQLIRDYGEKSAASSYGPFQIMLLKAHEMGFRYSPKELSDPNNNRQVAEKIVSQYMSKGLPIKDIFKRYNGGGKQADLYSQKAMKLYNSGEF